MIVNAQKQVYALESTVEGLNGRTERTVKHAVALKKHNEIRRVVKDVVLPEFSKQQVLKIAEQVIQEAENTILYACTGQSN
jgi:NCAIR mutase (PurE)-related protein